MLWRLEFDPDAKRSLERLPKNIVQRVLKALDAMVQNPRRGKKLEGYETLRSWPLTTSGGEYRIVYEVYLAEEVCHVILIATRERVYKLLRRRMR